MEHTPRNFALQLGSLISLYVTVGALLTLLFSTINTVFPDSADGMRYWAQGEGYAVRAAIATLIVFFPAYIILTRIVNTLRRAESSAYSALTRWVIYLSLLVGGGVLLGDLVVVLLGFLNGDLTIRFLLKALAVFVVVGAAFGYYVLDARSYWHTHEKESKLYGLGAALLVIAAIAFGYINTASPSEVRQYRIDEQVMNDLYRIESAVQDYYSVEQTLPADISTAFRGLSGIPTAPEDRAAYTFTTTGSTTYEVCAEFAFASDQGEGWYGGSWSHDAGNWCFKRAVMDYKN